MISGVPRLWNTTIAEHRRDVHAAILAAAAELVTARGLRGVTMSRIAEEAGIGRATLYKYFPSVEAIVLAWHERQIERHLEQLAEVRDRAGVGVEGLEAVLRAYALIMRETQAGHERELAELLHRDEHVAAGRARLHSLVRDLVDAGVKQGALRDDVPSHELTTYCLHALSAAGRLPSRAAVERLVHVTLSALRSA
jgi:AcrR family transcriptional regulator